jgi:hypothetical protein
VQHCAAQRRFDPSEHRQHDRNGLGGGSLDSVAKCNIVLRSAGSIRANTASMTEMVSAAGLSGESTSSRAALGLRTQD